MLHTSPSFSIFNTNGELEDEEHNDQGGMEREEELMTTVAIGERIGSIGSGRFSFGNKSMVLIEEEGEGEQEDCLNGIENFDVEEGKEPVSPPLYLAAGLGIDDVDFSGGFPLILPKVDENGDAEEYYKRMTDEYPCHPLLLSNYARLLQSKGDLHGAEEYYRRAILADPGDGEALMQHAKLEWELHHDQDRAVVNFERAVQAARQDSHILAAYASFLWELDDDSEGDASKQHIKIEEEGIPANLDELVNEENLKQLMLPAGLLIDMGDNATSDADKGGNSEDYYKRMVEDNPCNPLFLRNYAEFLSQSKGDLRGAEEYYSRAILADPGDGEILSQYAKLVWELYHDHDKAACCFERAVLATPEDSYVLAAYANFLWETENDEDNTNQFQIPNHHEGAAAAANA